MIQATQHKLIDRLADPHQQSPGVRFGRLQAALGFLVEDEIDQSLWAADLGR